MALSGSFGKNIGSHWRLQVDWSATQNIAGNQTTVTSRLYWMATSSYGAVYASSSRSGSHTVDGTTQNFTATAGLSANQKKLINTATKTITHNSDGTKNISISASFDIGATLGGTYYGNQTISSGTISLNTIPRASSITSSAGWTAPNNITVNISRASSSFTHTVRFYVQDTGGTNRLIKTITGVGTSVSSSFTTTENTNIFTYLAQRTSTASRIEVDTFSGSTKIGSTTVKTGTCSAPSSSTTSWGGNFDIGATMSGTVTRSNSSLTHTIQLIFGASTFTLLDKSSTTSWSYNTSTIATSLYNLTPNSNTLSGTIRILTYYNGVQVRSHNQSNVSCYVKNSNPTFNSNFTYADTNSTTATLTGNNQFIVQGKSSLTVTLITANRALPVNGATMVNYVATVNGVERTANWSSSATVTFSFGAVNASANTVLSVTAIDSRGNSTTTTKTITILPYSKPSITGLATRQNSFEEATSLTASGAISLLTVSGSNKNSIVSVQYRYKSSATTTWGAWTNFTHAMNGSKYSVTNVILTLSRTQSFNIEYKITDRLDSATVDGIITEGRPILFIDSKTRSVGIGKLPNKNQSLEVEGGIHTIGEIVLENTTTGNTFPSTIRKGAGATRDMLEIRARTTLTDGAGINLYGQDDSSSPNKILIWTNNKTTMGLEDGKVGVGTSSPRYDLDIIGTAYASVNLGVLNNNNNSSNMFMNFLGDQARIRIGGSATGAYNGLQIQGPGDDVKMHIKEDGSCWIKGDYTSDATARLVSLTGSATVRALGNGTASTVYLQAHTEAVVVAPMTTTSYKPIRASAFPVGSSVKYKDNITEFNEDVLGMLMSTPIYTYHLKTDLESGIYDKRKVGFIAEASPALLRDEDGVDPYTIMSVIWKQNQEQQKLIVELQKRVDDLELALSAT